MPPPASFDTISLRAAAYWRDFWRSGAAVDFSGSTNPRAAELERRVVLSQYLTAVNCSGTTPPQEAGLITNSWQGKSTSRCTGGTPHTSPHGGARTTDAQPRLVSVHSGRRTGNRATARLRRRPLAQTRRPGRSRKTLRHRRTAHLAATPPLLELLYRSHADTESARASPPTAGPFATKASRPGAEVACSHHLSRSVT